MIFQKLGVLFYCSEQPIWKKFTRKKKSLFSALNSWSLYGFLKFKFSNFSIFTFINVSDLKFCTRSYSSCVYRMMRFKGLNGKVCKMMTSYFRTIFWKKFGKDRLPYVFRNTLHMSVICLCLAYSLKLGCVTNFDILFLVIGFICLVNEIQFMLISSRHFSKLSKASIHLVIYMNKSIRWLNKYKLNYCTVCFKCDFFLFFFIFLSG